MKRKEKRKNQRLQKFIGHTRLQKLLDPKMLSYNERYGKTNRCPQLKLQKLQELGWAGNTDTTSIRCTTRCTTRELRKNQNGKNR
jgi:hypothetical protein